MQEKGRAPQYRNWTFFRGPTVACVVNKMGPKGKDEVCVSHERFPVVTERCNATAGSTAVDSTRIVLTLAETRALVGALETLISSLPCQRERKPLRR